MSFLSSYLFPSSLFSLILPLFVLVFLSFFPLLSLLSFVSIYRKTNGERVLLPLSGHGIGVGGGRAAIRQPPQGCPQSLFPLHFRLVVGHGLGFRQVGVFVGFVFGFWEREGEEKSKGTNASFSPVLCASMGRRRHMVPFKTTPFLLLFFSSYNA
jgi:hypothetical protein